MRPRPFVLAVSLLTATLAAAAIARAQTEAPMTSLEIAAACAPTTAAGPPERPLHIVGSQDVVGRVLYGSRDLLVVDGGTQAGVQLGQRFFVRRVNNFGTAIGDPVHLPQTAGWVTVVAVNDSTAIANVDYVCGPIFQMDYLEPYTRPALPDNLAHEDKAGDPDFSTLGHVLGGDAQRETIAIGEVALVDMGTDQGVTAGSRYAVFRDTGAQGVPLASIGEAVVISASATTSIARITHARDAIFRGDYVAPRK